MLRLSKITGAERAQTLAIDVLCSCGKTFTARDEHAGRRAKCPSCGSIITIEEPAVLDEAEPSPVNFKAITLNVGNLSNQSGYISFSINVTREGKGSVLLYACESDTRRKGEMIRLTVGELAELTNLLRNVSQAITQLQASRQMLKVEQ
jgi:hypothetical protein